MNLRVSGAAPNPFLFHCERPFRQSKGRAPDPGRKENHSPVPKIRATNAKNENESQNPS
jgi:hypothetical protein